MNIVLAEECSGEQLAERSFGKQVVLMGRDAHECDVAFEKDAFPMVSRRHAEVRWQDNKWWLNDLGSSYGTFLNDERVTVPAELSFGDSIRLGTDGPTVRVIWFEVAEFAGRLDTAVGSPSGKNEQHQPSQHELADSLEAPDGSRQIHLTGSIFWIGRDDGCDLVVDNSPLVSRRHAFIHLQNDARILADNNSFNGTFLNGKRLTEPALLAANDQIMLGAAGPVFTFRPAGSPRVSEAEAGSPLDPKTIVAKFAQPARGRQPSKHVAAIHFGSKQMLSIGRSESSDVRLDSLQVSKTHAQLFKTPDGFLISDNDSTNGVFVNGERIRRRNIVPEDEIMIGAFVLRVDKKSAVNVFDTRSQTRIDAVGLSATNGRNVVLDDVALSIQPNELVGVIGSSGAGKSTLLQLLAGARSPDAGRVLINGNDLSPNRDALRRSIGYVPQDDIVHGELSVERTLEFVAKLRLSNDVSSAEIQHVVDRVIELAGLGDRRKAAVGELSGGQRKRVSVAVELICRPAAIFLDEPTSGLDPTTSENMMILFRELADSGHTIVVSTHSIDNISFFDKIVVMSAGRVLYIGPPDECLTHFAVKDLRSLFSRLEAAGDPAAMVQSFRASPQYEKYVAGPLTEIVERGAAPKPKRIRLGIYEEFRQFALLSQRYFAIFRKDRLNMLILFAQAPVIALLTYAAVGKFQSRDFVYFLLALVSVWFGTSVAAREIVRERRVYERERMFNLGIFPYLGSKVFVLSVIVGVQCLLLFLPLRFLHLVGSFSMPGETGGLPQLWTMLLTGCVGVALGLFVSSVVRTGELATTLVPLILIPQILFSGLLGVPQGLSKGISLVMPAAWSFDSMKRFSTLDTLEPEGSLPQGKTRGLGLYNYVRNENEKLSAEVKRNIDEYKRSGTFYGGEGSGPPDIEKIQSIPADLSGYITFLNPWMGDVLNQVIMMLMFGILTLFSVLVLRLRDIR